ncbi:uncharacterized protein LOC127080911 [Lathyrus oleraceus]|uniref:uncharacterized protein LOC127080911 n=1 Tax=Pisum sativum TaxID=3888 RepID=UPI0021D3749A|nr:uncharacterized protein LOC127080911 [Pisum sativum]
MVPINPTRLVAAYPWGMSPHLAASLASGGAFFPHSDLTVVAGSVGFPWAGAPQAPNALFGTQYFQPATAAQTVPPGFSYPPMWFNPSVPAPIAPEVSRPASQATPPTVDPSRLADYQLLDDKIRGLYFEKMIDSSSTNFVDMVIIGEHVKSGLKFGKIIDTTAPQTVNKRPHGSFAKKKEEEANAIMAKARPRYRGLMAPMPYYPYQYVAAAQYQQPPFQYQPQKDNRQSTPAQRNPNQQYNRAQNRGNNFGNRPQFDKILVSYSELVPYLVHVGAVIPKEFPVATPPFRANHDPNASCVYHANFIGHSTENCWALKCKIQDLINQNILTFSEEKPNVKTNPLPNHSGVPVNAVIEEVNTEVILKVEEVKTLMFVVLQKIEQFGFLEKVHDDCTICEFDPDICEQLKGCVQSLMDQGLIQFSRAQAAEEVAVIEPITIVYRKKKVEAPPKRIQPIHFHVPTPFPYQNTKAVPWNYETTTYLGGKEIRILDIKIVNIDGLEA